MRKERVSAGELFVPGRLCMFGEHSDWAAEYRKTDPSIDRGYTISCGLHLGLHARVYLREDDFVFRSASINGEHKIFRTEMDLSLLLKTAESGGFWSYIAGAVYRIAERFPVQGLEIDNHTSGLPMNKGLGSSAAVSVLTVRAFNRAYGLGMTAGEEMEIAYLAEVTTPSKCGRMDQGCAYGKPPIFITHDADGIKIEKIPVGASIYFAVADLGGNKDTVRILTALHRSFPDLPGDIYKKVREYLGPMNKRTVFKAIGFLEAGDAEGLGDLMTRAQSGFDGCVAPACPSDLAAPLLHDVLKHPSAAPYIYGGKGVGSQGDGSVQFVCKDAECQEKLLAVLRDEMGLESFGFMLEPEPVNPDTRRGPRSS